MRTKIEDFQKTNMLSFSGMMIKLYVTNVLKNLQFYLENQQQNIIPKMRNFSL